MEHLQAMLSVIKWTDAPPKVTFVYASGDAWVRQRAAENWMEYLAFLAHEDRRRHEQLMPLYPMLDVELVALLRELVQHTFLYQIELLSIGPPLREPPDLGIIAEPLYEYMLDCERMLTYWRDAQPT